MNSFKIYIIISLVLLSLMSCTDSNKGDSSLEETTGENNMSLSKIEMVNGKAVLGQIEKSPIQRWVSARGYVDVPPAFKASVGVYYGGHVKSIDLLPGQRVKKGQVLFTLSNPQFIDMQQAYVEVNEAMKFAKEDYDRQALLIDENITSQKKFRKTESDFYALKAKHQALVEQLQLINIAPEKVEKGEITSRITIYSPIEGFISKINMNLGMYLEATDVAMEIINTEHIHLELKVFEKDGSAVSANQTIRFRIPEANNDSIMLGKVHVTGKTVHGTERTVDVHGDVDSGVGSLIHGMFVEAEICVGSDSLMSITSLAIIKRGGKSFVAVAQEPTKDQPSFQLKEVQIGVSDVDRVEIKNWVEFGDQKVLLNPL